MMIILLIKVLLEIQIYKAMFGIFWPALMILLTKILGIYVNGKIDGNPVLINNFGRLFVNTDNNIGYQTHVSSPNYFNGQISKVRIYNKNLSEDDLFCHLYVRKIIILNINLRFFILIVKI